MKKIFLVLIVMAIIFPNCTNDINVDSENVATNIVLPKHVQDRLIIENSKIIPLETNDDALLGYIIDIIENDQKIYILDQFRKQIYCFGMTGKFLGKIGNQGRGPYEYTSIRSFSIYENEIYILAFNKVIVFDKDSFKAIREINLKYIYPTGIMVGRESLVLSSNDNITKFALSFTSRNDGEFLKRDLTSKIKTNDGGIALDLGGFKFNPIPGENSSSLLYLTFSDNIYTVSDTGYYCSYKIDFGDRKIPEEILQKDTRTISDYWQDSHSTYSRIQEVFQVDNTLAVCLESKLTNVNYNSYLVYDGYKTFWYNELIDSKINAPVNIIGTSPDGFIGYFYPDDLYILKEELNSNISTGYIPSEDEKKFLEQFDENDNPYLVIFNFRN